MIITTPSLEDPLRVYSNEKIMNEEREARWERSDWRKKSQ